MRDWARAFRRGAELILSESVFSTRVLSRLQLFHKAHLSIDSTLYTQLDASNLDRVLCCAPLDHEPPHCNDGNALYSRAAAPR